MTVEYRHDREVAFRGLERFFDEGMTLWPKEKFFSLFSSKEIANSSYVMQKLTDLERQGVICFVGADELCVEILKI